MLFTTNLARLSALFATKATPPKKQCWNIQRDRTHLQYKLIIQSSGLKGDFFSLNILRLVFISYFIHILKVSPSSMIFG